MLVLIVPTAWILLQIRLQLHVISAMVMSGPALEEVPSLRQED